MHYISADIQFLQKLYSICRQSVLQVVAQKDPICCLLESFKNFYNFDKQAADIRRYSNYAYFSNNKA